MMAREGAVKWLRGLAERKGWEVECHGNAMLRTNPAAQRWRYGLWHRGRLLLWGPWCIRWHDAERALARRVRRIREAE